MAEIQKMPNVETIQAQLFKLRDDISQVRAARSELAIKIFMEPENTEIHDQIDGLDAEIESKGKRVKRLIDALNSAHELDKKAICASRCNARRTAEARVNTLMEQRIGIVEKKLVPAARALADAFNALLGLQDEVHAATHDAGWNDIGRSDYYRLDGVSDGIAAMFLEAGLSGKLMSIEITRGASYVVDPVNVAKSQADRVSSMVGHRCEKANAAERVE